MNTIHQEDTGQALVELALALTLFLVFVSGIVDFGRAVYYEEVITNLSGEGASMASRQTTATNTVAVVMTDADLNMNALGCVIVTSITSPSSSVYKVATQVLSTPCNGGRASKIGCPPPTAGCGSATIPSTVKAVLDAKLNSLIYVTEIYYTFQSVTPVGALLKRPGILPAQLYSVAYY